MSFFGRFRQVKQGDRPSAAEWNRLVRLVEQISSSLLANGMFSPGTGFLSRRGLGGGGSPIFLAQANASAGVTDYIPCTIMDSNGSPSGATVNVYGLRAAVGHPSTGGLNLYVPRIVEADILPIFRGRDGNWYFCTIFQLTIDCVCEEPQS